jgi:hypothetical protein
VVGVCNKSSHTSWAFTRTIPFLDGILIRLLCRNLNFGFVTKAKGLQGCRPRGRKPESQGKGIARVRAKKTPGSYAKKKPGSHITYSRESHHILPRVLESVREYEGVNPHTPKATPTWGDGVLVDSQNFREQLQGPKLNGLWRSLYHWKALGA